MYIIKSSKTCKPYNFSGGFLRVYGNKLKNKVQTIKNSRFVFCVILQPYSPGPQSVTSMQTTKQKKII